MKWRRPFATDTSGHMPTITSFPKGIVSPHDFPIGKTRIIYTATDHSGNSHSCVFTVTIVGEYFWKKVLYFLFWDATICKCCQILVCETIILSLNCWSCYFVSVTCFFSLSTKLFWQVILTERTLIKENLFLQGINDFMQLATPVNVSLVRVSFHMELKVLSS